MLGQPIRLLVPRHHQFLSLCSALTIRSLDHLIRSLQAEGLGGLEVDDQLERPAQSFTHPSCSATFKELRDGCDKVGHVDGFALVPVERGGHDLPPVLAHDRRGHGHDGNPPGGRLGAEPSERLDPVNPGSRSRWSRSP